MVKKIGFTLAEVLITLAIIGVVAALTIPSIIANNRKKEFETGFAKAYRTVTQAIMLSQAENGELTDWPWDTATDNTKRAAFIETYILPYFNVVKNCKFETNKGCFQSGYVQYLKTGNWHNPDAATDRYKFTTADGMSWTIGYWDSGCITNKKRCARIDVDTNGKKSPYIYGMDFFAFELYPITNEVMPLGVYNNGSAYDETKKEYTRKTQSEVDSNCSKTGNGDYCAAKIVSDGFKINYL